MAPLSFTMSFQDSFDGLFKAINKTFGTQVTYTYAADSSTSSITGVFENGFVTINEITTQKPLLKNVRLSELDSEPTEGDTVTIGSVDYEVEDHQSDGLGTTTLILKRI